MTSPRGWGFAGMRRHRREDTRQPEVGVGWWTRWIVGRNRATPGNHWWWQCGGTVGVTRARRNQKALILLRDHISINILRKINTIRVHTKSANQRVQVNSIFDMETIVGCSQLSSQLLVCHEIDMLATWWFVFLSVDSSIVQNSIVVGPRTIWS
mgnify:CR=1 FL=1